MSSRRRRLFANKQELRATSEVSRSSVPAKTARAAEERRRWGDVSSGQPTLGPSTHGAGAVPPVRLNVYWSGSQEPWRFAFDQPSLLLGRAEGADLQQIGKVVFRAVIPAAAAAPPAPGHVRAETASGPSLKEPASSLSTVAAAMLPIAYGGLQEIGAISTAQLPEELITAILNRIVGVQNAQMAEFVATITDVQRQYLEQLRNELSEVRELKNELSTIRDELHASRNLPAATVPPPSTADQDHQDPASNEIPALTDGPSRDPDARRQHEWIMQRLAQIESEKTGRWKTVLQALTRPHSGRN